MNKIYKVIYSKVRQCYVVVSEIAKSHGRHTHSSVAKSSPALTAAVLIALGSLSVTTAFMPMTAEAADKTKTDGSNFVGVERTDGLLDDSKYDNYGGKGAQGADSITLGLKAQAGSGTITIGDRNAGASLGSVYVGQGDVANPKADTGGWATSIGYNSDATGYGSIALGSNAVAKNSYAKDSKGESLELNQTYVDNGVTKVRLNSKPDIQRASVAIGYGASADNGNIAIGSYSDASTDLRTVTDDKAKAYLTDKTADSYVSVGKSDALRRISNVADGAASSDVATVGQLQALSNKVGVYNAGFGIKIDSDTAKKTNTISLNRNLGTNLDKTGNLDLTVSDTGLVLDTVVPEDLWQKEKEHGLNFQHFGATGDYAVTVGGVGSMATGKYSTVSGGYLNTAEGEESAVFGGSLNKASKYNDSVFGGTKNVANGSSSSILGGSNNTTSASDSVIVGGNQNATEGLGMNSTVLGGSSNKTSGQYSVVAGGDKNQATGKNSSVFGGVSNTASGEDAVASGGNNNTASGEHASAFGGSNNKVKGQNASVFGGYDNSASGQESAVVGGTGNTATHAWASVFGGVSNTATGLYSAVTGGSKNIVNGSSDFAAGGTNNRVLGDKDAAFGGKDSVVQGTNATGVAGGSTGAKANNALAAGYQSVVTTANGTSIGYQSTTNEDGTIAFGHDKGDVSGYTVTWKQKATTANGKYYDANGNEIDKNKYDALKNSDSTYNDYTQAPIIEENTYTSAQYNRLVKVADGQKAHDTVVLEQLKPYTKSDATNIGANLKTYTVGDDGETITEAAASDDAKNTNENAWGVALGTGKVADPNVADAEKNGSKQLVTGGTVYTALQNQKTDLTNDLSVHAGWGINIADEKDPETGAVTKKNVISLNRNLGTKLGTSEKVNLTAGNTGLVLGTVVTDDLLKDTFEDNSGNKIKIDFQNLGATGDHAVTVGGDGLMATGKYSTALGGYVNMATGDYSSVSGGHVNTASGSYASVSGGWNNEAKASYSSVAGGTWNTASGSGSFVAGGFKNEASGQDASIVGGTSNKATAERSAVFGGSDNIASKKNSSVFGGFKNEASKDMAVVSGGESNTANGLSASVFGGHENTASGDDSAVAGGHKNTASGQSSTAVGGGGNTAAGYNSAVTGGSGNIVNGNGDFAAGGLHNIVIGDEHPDEHPSENAAFGGMDSVVQGKYATGVAGGSTGAKANNALAAGYQSVVTTENGTSIGYQSTTNEDGTIAFGHDKGDVSGYNVTWQKRTDKDAKGNIVKNADGTTNDYTKAPTITENTYTSAQYNRLVKVADGQKAHDTVVMEQLKPYTKSDASNIGANLKTYTVGDDGETVTGADATADQQKANKDAWGKALGAGTLSTADAAKNSDQLVTGKTLYNYDAPVAETGKTLTYVSANNTTGQNLSALDSALQTVNTKAGAHTALTVESGTAAGKDDEKNKDVYAGKNILLHESADANGKVTYDLKLAKDLQGITSISNQTTTKDGDKEVTTGAKIDLGSNGNISVNGGKITNVGSGIEKDDAGNITDASKTNAANIGDVQTIAGNATADLTNKGLKFAANSGAEYTAKLGTTVKIQGTAKKDGHEYTADNLTTAIDKDGNITIMMDKNISAEKLAVNGKDGKDGAPGTAGSIGISGQDGKAGIGIDGKDGISIKGHDGKDGVTMKAVDGKNGTEGHIGLTGPAGTNGKDGTNAIDITVKNGYDDTAKGINGTNGVDGKDGITRIVYTDKTGEHQVATMEDGMKFKGDDTTVIAKKLNNTLDIIGGADSTKLTDKNIGVNSTDRGQLKVQLAKDLQGITSISNQTTTKDGDKDVTTGAKIDLGSDGSVDVNGGKITNVGSGIEQDANGKYTVTDQNKGNAANIGDVQNMVNDAKKDLTDGANGLNSKANVDASNIGTNLKNADGSAASAEDQKANAEKWGSAIGTGEIKADDGRMVTGKTVYNEVRPKADGSYVKTNKTTGENLSALDTQVKKNADDITNINKSISSLDQNAVKYDDSNKSKVTLGGKDGTTITNVKDGTLSEKSTDAVNGKQLYDEQQAREAADKAISDRVTNNTDEITKIKNGDFTDASKTAIHNIAKDAVEVVDGVNTTVTKTEGTDTTPTKYAVNVEGKGKVASGDTGLISGDTLYKEVHVDKDGSYIKSGNTVGQNLSSLDTGLKTTSDLIHTNDKGDTIQIGGDSTATKIDVSGKDKDGKSTGRVITGVVSDANDPNSAANVGYVNGITAASDEQIYRDMNMQYNHVENDISRAAAGSNALAALHPMQEFDPDDKAQFALGYGHYRNSNAGAVGAFYQPDENSLFSFGVSFGNGDAGLNAGVTFKFGPGGSNHHALTKTQMAKVIDTQSKEIDELKKDNADKDKRIDALEQKMAEIMAKLDQQKG